MSIIKNNAVLLILIVFMCAQHLQATITFGSNSSGIILQNADSQFSSNASTITGWARQSITQQTSIDGNDNLLANASAGTISYAAAPTNAATTLANNVTVNNTKLNVLGNISETQTLSGRTFLNSPIDLAGGTLTFGGDLVLSSASTIASSGIFNMRGFAMVLGGDLTIPNGVDLVLSSSGIIDGQGNNIIFQGTGRIMYDSHVSATIRNARLKNVANHGGGKASIGIKREHRAGLTLQNAEVWLSSNYSFTAARLYFNDDVALCGTNSFVYTSTQQSIINSYATLLVDQNATFTFSPASTNANAKYLLALADASATLALDGSTLAVGPRGLQLTTGTVLFDNAITIQNNGSSSITFDASVNVKPLGSSRVQISGTVSGLP